MNEKIHKKKRPQRDAFSNKQIVRYRQDPGTYLAGAPVHDQTAEPSVEFQLGVRVILTAAPTLSEAELPMILTLPVFSTEPPVIFPAATTVRLVPAAAQLLASWHFSVISVLYLLAARINSDTFARTV